jgi:penicillin amidase
MTLPPMWYLLHLKAGTDGAHSADYEVWGASIPGIPGIQIGHNRWIAWGVTAAVCDDLELYREKIHRLEPNRYLTEYEWMNMEHRTEIIRVRREKDVTKAIRSTCRGPVISDFSVAGGAKEVLSLRWTAHEPTQDVHCLYGVNCARNWTDFLDSLSYQGAPALNYVYADQSGNIGYSLAGKIPIRRQAPSLLPADGWQRNNDWVGYVPFDELPRIYNPSEGAVATANNRIADSSYGYHLSSFFEPPYRIARIKELLAQRETHAMADMAAIQMDVVSLHAKDLIDSLRAELSEIPETSPKLNATANRLLRWDWNCHADSVESSIFHAFHQRVMANLLVPVIGEECFKTYVEILNQCLTPLAQILKDCDSPWFAAEPRSALIKRSLQEACEELELKLGADVEGWQWAKIHQLTLGHLLGRVRLLERTVSLGPLPSPGDGTTVNLGFYRHSNPYRHAVGPSLRMIVDLSALRVSRFIVSSGQSGHPFSPHYNDQVELWRRGDSVRLYYDDEEMTNWPRLIMHGDKEDHDDTSSKLI